MKIYKNGICIGEKPPKAICEPKAPVIPYKDMISLRIRERYSIDDELAILRQRDEKPEEFSEYNTFVEKIKAEEKEKIIEPESVIDAESGVEEAVESEEVVEEGGEEE